MSSLADFGEARVATLLAGDGPFQVRLYDADLNDDGSGGSELTGDGYSAQSVTLEQSGSLVRNAAQVQFSVTAQKTYKSRAVTDTSGNIIFFENAAATKTIEANGTATFPAESITCTFA